MRTNADKGEWDYDSMQLSIAQRLAAFLVTPTVTAVAVLNGLLGSLDVCCLWHEAHASVKR